MVIGGSSGSAGLDLEPRQVLRHRIVESQLALLAQLHDRRRGEELAVRRHPELGLRRHRQLRGGVGESESGRPDEILIRHHADGDAWQVPIQHLPFEPRREEPLGGLHVGVVGDALGRRGRRRRLRSRRPRRRTDEQREQRRGTEYRPSAGNVDIAASSAWRSARARRTSPRSRGIIRCGGRTRVRRSCRARPDQSGRCIHASTSCVERSLRRSKMSP